MILLQRTFWNPDSRTSYVLVDIGNYFEWHTALTDTVKYYYSGATRVAMRVGANPPVCLMGDHLGSTSVAVNEQGTPVNGGPQLYKAWGETRAGSLPTAYQFTGQFNQVEIGLYYYGARWYDVSLGRFIQADLTIPYLYNPQAYDRYSYVFNNPMRFIDPSGNKLCDGRDAGEPDGECTPADDPFTKDELEDALSFETGIDKDLLDNLSYDELNQAYTQPEDYLIGLIEDSIDSNPLNSLLGWRWTPLAMAALQLLSVDGFALLVPLVPSMPDAALVGFIILAFANRGSAILGIVSTGYQYKNGLNGTQSTDVLVSATTMVTGWFPDFTLSSAHLNFWYSVYRSCGGPLPSFLP